MFCFSVSFFSLPFFRTFPEKNLKQKIIENNDTHTHTHKENRHLTWKTALTFEVSTGWFLMSNGRWKVAETNKFPKIFTQQFLPIFICCFVFQVEKKWIGKPAHACVLFASVNEMNGIILKLSTSLMSLSAESGQVAKYHVPKPILTKTTILFNVCSLVANSLSHSFSHIKHTHKQTPTLQFPISKLPWWLCVGFFLLRSALHCWCYRLFTLCFSFYFFAGKMHNTI